MTMNQALKILLIDNYDSFTYNLYDYFLQLGTECTVIRNNEIPFEEIHNLSFDAIVLSPGPKRPADAGFMMELIAYYFDKIPILGICLGHQGIGEFFGASLQKASLPMHGKTSSIKHNQHPLFKNLPEQYKVMRYHSLLLKDLDKTPLISIAQTKENENMAIAHPDLPIYGVQFHPESILTEHGLELLGNWLTLVRNQLHHLREMLPEEASIVSELITQTQKQFNLTGLTPTGQKHLLENIFAEAKLLERQKGGSRLMVSTIKDNIVGMAEYSAPGHIKLLFIKRVAQGFGLGTLFIKTAIKWTRQHFPDTKFLTVSSAPSAVNFYLKCGFEKIGPLKVMNGVPFIPMHLRL